MTNWLGVDVCLAEFVSDSNGLVNGLVTRSDKRTCRQEVGSARLVKVGSLRLDRIS